MCMYCPVRCPVRTSMHAPIRSPRTCTDRASTCSTEALRTHVGHDMYMYVCMTDTYACPMPCVHVPYAHTRVCPMRTVPLRSILSDRMHVPIGSYQPCTDRALGTDTGALRPMCVPCLC